MTAEKLLQKVRSEQLEIIILQDQIDKLRYSLLPKAITYDSDKVQTAPEDKMPEILGKVDELEHDLKDRLLKLIDRQQQASAIINRLEKSEHRQVLQLYYLNPQRLHWEDVAMHMGYSVQHIYRYHAEAMEILNDESE